MASSALLLIGGILALVSAFTAWWAASFSGVTLSFFPGTSYQESGGGSTLTSGYASNGFGQIGGVYEAILALTIVGGALALIAGIVGFVATSRRRSSPGLGATGGLAIAAFLLILVAAILAPAIQPWAWDHTSNGCGSSGFNGTSPCSAFWGSGNSFGGSYTFGAAIGWYLALVSFILVLVGLILWRSGRP